MNYKFKILSIILAFASCDLKNLSYTHASCSQLKSKIQPIEDSRIAFSQHDLTMILFSRQVFGQDSLSYENADAAIDCLSNGTILDYKNIFIASEDTPSFENYLNHQELTNKQWVIILPIDNTLGLRIKFQGKTILSASKARMLDNSGG